MCGSRETVARIRSLASYDEMLKRAPDVLGALQAAAHEGGSIVIPTAYGPMVCVGDVLACHMCRAAAERAAAQHPSWMLVDIDRGPGPDRVVGQVKGG